MNTASQIQSAESLFPANSAATCWYATYTHARHLACERMGIPPQKALAFDDASAGVEAARTAGMRCIGVASNGHSANLVMAGAELVIPDFAGLAFDSIAATPTKWAAYPPPKQSSR